MFREAKAFNQDISEWDVDNVTNMNGMFLDASSFNQDLDIWDKEDLPHYKQLVCLQIGLEGNEPCWYNEEDSNEHIYSCSFTDNEGFTSNYNDYDDDEYNDTCYYINSGNHILQIFSIICKYFF